MRQTVAAVSCLIFFTACAAHKHYATDSAAAAETVRPDVENNGFSLATIEFDDHGEPWDRWRLDDVMHAIDTVSGGFDEPLQPQGALVVVFVHGWKHSAHPDDGNLRSFRHLLARLAEEERVKERPRAVLGIYMGWRGGSLLLPEPLKSLSYFDRYDAAARVAGPAMTQTLFAIMKVVRRNENSRCVLVGHSMGGLILPKAVVQAFVGLIAERATDVVAERSERRRGHSSDTATVTSVCLEASKPAYGYRPPADLVVFVNSAAPAIEAKQFVEILDELAFTYYFPTAYAQQRAEQTLGQLIATDDLASWRPFVLSITSEGDWATGKIFPFARAIDRIGKRFRAYSKDGDWNSSHPTQRQLYSRTAAFVPDLTSHTVTVEDLPRTKAVAATPCELPYIRQASDDALCFESRSKRYIVTRRLPLELDGSRVLASTFNRTPYWIMKVPRGLIKDHNDIFNDGFLDFLRGVIGVAAELHETVAGPQWPPDLDDPDQSFSNR